MVMTTRRPKGETLAEHFARMTDRIAQLETQIRDLMDENAELRQQIDACEIHTTGRADP